MQFVYLVGIPLCTPHAKVEHAAHRPSNHEFFIRVNDANRNPAGRRGNHVLICFVSLFFEFDSKESHPFTNTGSHDRAVFTYATGKNQRVQSAQGCCERTDPLLRLITK